MKSHSKAVLTLACWAVCQLFPASGRADLVVAGLVPTSGQPGTAPFVLTSDKAWQKGADKLTAIPTASQNAIATFTIPADGAGFYALRDTLAQRNPKQQGTVELRVQVEHAGLVAKQPDPAVVCPLTGAEPFEFDNFLGYLAPGDKVILTLSPDGEETGDDTQLQATLVRISAIDVTAFPADLKGADHLEVPAAWSILANLPPGNPAARITATPSTDGKLPLNPNTETLAAFRVPRSGYYALANASATVPHGEARIYVGSAETPLRRVNLQGKTSLDTDLGYLAKGETIYLAFTANTATPNVSFAGEIVEWAPRRAPLRVKRGANGYLNVYEPQAQTKPITIPTDRWIDVEPAEGDSTAVLRAALDKAKAQAADGKYAGVRLAPGKAYRVCTTQSGGDVFSFRDAKNILFDGRGSTILIDSPNFAREDMQFIATSNSKNIVFHDLIVDATSLPFATGELLSVTPAAAGAMTARFKLLPGSPDPIKDIARNGNTNVYVYDPAIPGREAINTWSHYPNVGTPDKPGIRPVEGQPGVFEHTVTRTAGLSAIKPGAKWLVKNKNAGLVYLATRGSSENITLSSIDCRAAGGGLLRFWQTSGINLLNCRMEPAGNNWISSSADGIHGRGREGVWVEDTILRGICEDIMNTYASTLLVLPDDNDADNTVTLRNFNRGGTGGGGPSKELGGDPLALGDTLCFFNPKTGKVLGRAQITKLSGPDGRVTLSQPIAGIDYSAPGKGATTTTVYNDDAAARFFIRDSKFMDSMRYGVYIKARGGVIFGSTFEGLPSNAIFMVNEPEWPEGPPGTDVWIQGNTFWQNNFSYMSMNRAFLNVDPADISIYTRHFRDPSMGGGGGDYTAFLTHNEYANAHVKILGNTFADWRGMAVSVRNSRNVNIANNLFLPPIPDPVMAKTLAKDTTLSNTTPAIYLDSVAGVRLTNNDLSAGPNTTPIRGPQTSAVTETPASAVITLPTPDFSQDFNDWFPTDKTTRTAGLLGPALSSSATIANFPAGGKAGGPETISLWLNAASTTTPQNATILSQGELSLTLKNNRLTLTLGTAALDLGPAALNTWQHLAFTLEPATKTLTAYSNATKIASATLAALPNRDGPLALGQSLKGAMDSLAHYSQVLTPTQLSHLALKPNR